MGNNNDQGVFSDLGSIGGESAYPLAKKGGRRERRTRKQVPWAGWSKEAPFGAARTRMYRKCGKKCFLGTKTPGDKQHPNFPICKKNTCKVSSKGLWAAYIRAKEWGNKRSSYKGKGHPRMRRGTYTRIADKSKRMLRRRGFKVGGKKTRKN